MSERSVVAQPRRGRKRAIGNRAEIRAAAAALFAEQGYRATGVRDIADALGTSTSSVYSHVDSKAELLHEIVLDTCAALLAIQREAQASTTDPVQQLRRAAESQVRYLVAHPTESIVAIREFRWAEGDQLAEIMRLRHEYRDGFMGMLMRGAAEGKMQVENAKIAAFSIIEMAEAVPTWFKPDREFSANQIAYLYAEYALRIVGVHANHAT
jgi:TetR/AcrR family transcriptional regulator, cholesterol catabolism regulator